MYFFRVYRRRRCRRPIGGRRQYLKYRELARALVHQKIAQLNQIYQFSFGRVSIKNLKSRWGSCSQKRNLNFNYKIIFLPDHLADYLVAHELCHLGELNHSKNFWNLVAQAIPNYKKAKKEMKDKF